MLSSVSLRAAVVVVAFLPGDSGLALGMPAIFTDVGVATVDAEGCAGNCTAAPCLPISAAFVATVLVVAAAGSAAGTVAVDFTGAAIAGTVGATARVVACCWVVECAEVAAVTKVDAVAIAVGTLLVEGGCVAATTTVAPRF